MTLPLSKLPLILTPLARAAKSLDPVDVAIAVMLLLLMTLPVKVDGVKTPIPIASAPSAAVTLIEIVPEFETLPAKIELLTLSRIPVKWALLVPLVKEARIEPLLVIPPPRELNATIP